MAGVSLAEVGSAGLFGLPGCVLVLTTVFMPVAMLLTMSYLRTADPRLEEAGRLVARWPRVLCGITLPMIRPGLVWAALLIFLLAVGEVSVPMYLRYDVFPVEILTQFRLLRLWCGHRRGRPASTSHSDSACRRRAILGRTAALRAGPHGVR